MGAKFLNETLQWQGSKVYVGLQRYGSKVTQGIGSIGLRSYIESSAEEKDGKAKKAAEDF